MTFSESVSQWVNHFRGKEWLIKIICISKKTTNPSNSNIPAPTNHPIWTRFSVLKRFGWGIMRPVIEIVWKYMATHKSNFISLLYPSGLYNFPYFPTPLPFLSSSLPSFFYSFIPSRPLRSSLPPLPLPILRAILKSTIECRELQSVGSPKMLLNRLKWKKLSS